MSLRYDELTSGGSGGRYRRTIDVYGRVVSVVLLLLGLRQWAVIVGLASSFGGDFETMTIGWKVATMYLAVINLVAAVGLWMRVAWGNVLWLCAAASVIAFHTYFIEIFGTDYPAVIFHVVAMSGYAVLIVLTRKEQKSWPFHR
jgi:uncharacterized membrane protein (DUF2068 family)